MELCGNFSNQLVHENDCFVQAFPSKAQCIYEGIIMSKFCNQIFTMGIYLRIYLDQDIFSIIKLTIDAFMTLVWNVLVHASHISVKTNTGNQIFKGMYSSLCIIGEVYLGSHVSWNGLYTCIYNSNSVPKITLRQWYQAVSRKYTFTQYWQKICPNNCIDPCKVMTMNIKATCNCNWSRMEVILKNMLHNCINIRGFYLRSTNGTSFGCTH